MSYSLFVALEELANRGLYHLDIRGGGDRGAFDIKRWQGGDVPTYPALWGHDAARERYLVVEPDTYGAVREGMENKAAETWSATASRFHFNLDFRLNSQSLAACWTSEPCIGGRAWPNVLPHHDAYGLPLLLWSNTTTGMILYWWRGTRQQQGRVNLTITAIPQLPVLDASAFDGKQLGKWERVFDDFRGHSLRPANEAYRDETRKALDEAVLFDLLGLPSRLAQSLDLLRLKWCSEPSVHGGKPTRPQDA